MGTEGSSVNEGLPILGSLVLHFLLKEISFLQLNFMKGQY